MDDSQYGIRDRRGYWRPFKPVMNAPIFVWPVQPKVLAKWLFGHDGYMLPWNLFYASIAVFYWFYLTPSIDTMKTLTFDWPIYLLICNAVILFLVTGSLHLYLYVRRAQVTQFKHNAQWPSKNNSAFLFRNQNIDNLIWTFASGVPVWTGFEVLLLWAFANGYAPFVSFSDHPIYLTALFFLVPIWRGGVHFYFIHRLLHVPIIYRWVHNLHHNNVNPGPWTGLAMHPVEQLFFYSSVLIYFIVPAHPLIVIFEGIHASLSPGIGHSGFERIVLGRNTSVTTHDYFHYLHHKYFECNYGLGLVPFDKWFGTFHDGTEESDKRMNERYIERARSCVPKKSSNDHCWLGLGRVRRGAIDRINIRSSGRATSRSHVRQGRQVCALPQDRDLRRESWKLIPAVTDRRGAAFTYRPPASTEINA